MLKTGTGLKPPPPESPPVEIFFSTAIPPARSFPEAGRQNHSASARHQAVYMCKSPSPKVRCLLAQLGGGVDEGGADCQQGGDESGPAETSLVRSLPHLNIGAIFLDGELANTG